MSRCNRIWLEASARLLLPPLCVAERSMTCCCIASTVSTDTLRISQEWIACLAVSCIMVKSWKPGVDSNRSYAPHVHTTERLCLAGLAFSIVRTTSRTDQTDESCSSRRVCTRGTCKEKGSEGGSLGHMWHKVCCRRCWNVESTPIQRIRHLRGFQRAQNVISCQA
jgi:hypothetical protein